MTQAEPLFEAVDGVECYRGLSVERCTVNLAGLTFRLAGLKDAADLLDLPDFAQRFVEEDLAPYGIELWPAAVMLADHVLRGEHGQGRTAIELGCGLGLVSLAAASRGWQVLATDLDPVALRFAEYNAAANGIEIAGFELLDWHTPPDGKRYDRILAADVLYQLVDHAPLLRCLDRLLADDGVALVADPHRGVADRFESMAVEHGFDVQLIATTTINNAKRPVEGRVFRLRKPSASDTV